MLQLMAMTLVLAGQVRSDAWEQREAGQKPRTVALPVLSPDLISARRGSRPLPPWPTGSQIILADGSRLAGTRKDGNDRSVTVARSGSVLSLPFETVNVLWIGQAPAGMAEDPSKYTWLPSPRKKDILLLTSGDTV